MLIESFAALSGIEGLGHGFVPRISTVDVVVEREAAMKRLRPAHGKAIGELGISHSNLWTAEQVHACEIVECRGNPADRHQLGVDGLMTSEQGVYLGIYVADCCAVFLVDIENRACALLHSGKCGTELEIVPQAIERMRSHYGTKPGKLIAQLSPCIRPPWYEIDFAKIIRGQCKASGLASENIHDAGICTAQEVDRYYSYRREKGRTGRMLAVLGWGMKSCSIEQTVVDN